MLRSFLHDEAGAVTIDFVAITAGVLLLGIALVYGIFNSGVASTASGINAALAGVQLASAGSAPRLNGAAAPMLCNDSTCIRDSNGDGNYDEAFGVLSEDPWSSIGGEVSPNDPALAEGGFAPASQGLINALNAVQ